MTPERYRQVNALADVALQMSQDERDAFLTEVCGSDLELRKQIEALIAADSDSGGFLEKTLLEVLAGDMLAQPLQRDLAGRRIANYEVLSRLGAGGIGEVWLARDVKLNRDVALKLLAPRFAGDPYHVRHFQREARTASGLNHPNIVTVYEIGETEGAMFIAEERVVGETIRQRLAPGPIPLRETLDIGSQIAAALGAAHLAGVVHRDIKPENAMIRPDGLVKVLDFGLARFVERPANGPDAAAAESASLPGFVLGTVRYMSPEQARGLPVDHLSDIFSLGVMLYEMASGMPPFSGSTPTDTLAAILTSDPAPLSRYIREVPVEFERTVRRCMAKDPAERYATAEALNADLTKLSARLAKRRTSAPKPWLIGVAGLAALAGVAGVALLIDRKQPSAAPFNSMQITRLATRVEATDAAIAHDGKLLAYVANDGPGQSIWMRAIDGSNERAIVPAESGEHSGVIFSTDDRFLYYRRRNADEIGDLYRVPVDGGTPERVAGDVSGPAAFSPDGRRIAFVRLNPSSWEASLIVGNAGGGAEQTLATRRRPQYFDEHSVAWSPDGRSIACFAGQGVRHEGSHLWEVRLADGSQRLMSEQSWTLPQSVAWSDKDNVLIVTAAAKGDGIDQLWMIQPKNGAVNRLTNDLSNYGRATLAKNGNSLVTLETETSAAIWVGDGTDPARFERLKTTPLRSRNITLAWTPDGRILYSSPIGGYRNLSQMDADGGNRRLLTSGSGDKGQMSMSRDGRSIIYGQNGNIWRMDADGTHPQQLTHGSHDVHPDVSADGRSVVYASFANWSPAIGGEPTLWRIPIDGGEPVEISRQPASYPRESPDGRRLGFVYFPGKDPRVSAAQVAMLALDGSRRFTVFEASPSENVPIEWSPGGKSLDYVENVHGIGNIWRQPIDGRPATPITKFATDELFGFAWSRDARRMACIRGATTSSVVLIEKFR